MDLRTEVLAGATTFMTMAYVLFVHRAIRSAVTDHAAGRCSSWSASS
jgi:xanthine/uracil/vitamin C permease (AzgA family)